MTQSPNIEHLESAMAALEAQRQALGDAVVDAALAPLRAERDTLRPRTFSPAASPSNSVRRQLAQMNQADLIRFYSAEPDLAYIFKHALIQEAAYDSLLVKTRHEIHRLVVQAYEQLYSERLDEYAALLAYHCAQAGDDGKLVEYAIRASESAANAYALPEALQFTAQALGALSRLPDSEDNRRRHIDLIMKRAPIAWVADTPEHNFANLEKAESLACSLAGEHGQHDDRLRLARLRYLIGSGHMARNELSATLRYVEQAHTDAQSLGDSDLLTDCSVVLGATLALRGQFIQAEPLLRSALERMEPTASFVRWEWTGAVGYLCLSLAAQGQLAEGLAIAERGMTLLREAKNQSLVALLESLQGLAFLLADQPQHALDMARAELVDAEQSGSHMYMVFGLMLRAWAESRLGHYAGAREALTQLRATAQQISPQLLFGDWLAAAEAEMALNAGDVRAALVRAERAAAYAHGVEGAYAEGLALRIWGEALAAQPENTHANRRDAEARLETSLELFESGGAAIEATRARAALDKLRG